MARFKSGFLRDYVDMAVSEHNACVVSCLPSAPNDVWYRCASLIGLRQA
jgi:hypothetical protein